VVTLMGLLALPAMLRAGYSVPVAAGAITAGGCLGILIPPSVLLIVYGATAGVSVVQLYAGAFFPGVMLASLYVGYVIVLAKIKPQWMPPLSAQDRIVPLPPAAQALSKRGRHAFTGLLRAMGGSAEVPKRTVVGQLAVSLIPALSIAFLLGVTYHLATAPAAAVNTEGLVEAGGTIEATADAGEAGDGGLAEPPMEEEGLAEPPAGEAKEAAPAAKSPAKAKAKAAEKPAAEKPAAERLPMPTWYLIFAGIGIAVLALIYWLWSWERLEIFKMLLTSFFPLSVLILAVLGSIVFGLATPTEAAAVGAFGGCLLALGYRYAAALRNDPTGAMGRTVRDLGGIVKESSFLTAKTSAMVCWLFVGSSIFSASFALLGGQEIIERWVLSLGLTTIQFMILAQFIIFILGWPLEWTEIIVIFMPIFIPLLVKFNVDPLFFGLLVALNLQTAFLSPPVAMAAFYLKGVSPPHVTLNQIFLGMLPFMGIQVVALALLYIFPGIGLWLPSVLYN